MTYTMRPYQEECIDILNNLPSGSRVMCVLATGLGKTMIFTHLKRTGRTLILSHRDELVRQPQKYYDCSFGVEKADEMAGDEEVVSASVQSLSRGERLKRFDRNAFHTIVIDEAHHSASPSYMKIIEYFNFERLIGFTATPSRGDGARLDHIYDEIVYSRDLLWGIRAGWLCNLKAVAIDVDVDISNVQMSMGDYNAQQLDALYNVDNTFSAVAKAYKKYASGKHCLIYCLNVQSCYDIKDAIGRIMPEAMDRIGIITGSTPQEERQALLEAYQDPEKKISCLINCMVLTEGTDLPITDAIICARPSCNESLYTQIVGRGARLYPGKESCLIIDIMPDSTHKLCCLATLAGVDYKSQKKKTKEIKEEDLEDTPKDESYDILSLSDDQDAYMKALMDMCDLTAFNYDLVNGLYKEREKALDEAEDDGLKGLNQAVSGAREAEKTRAKEEDGEIDFHDLHYTIGEYDDCRYIVNSEHGIFYVSKPDVLGKSHVKCRYQEKDYASKAPMPVSDIFLKIRKVLEKDDKKRFLWDEVMVRSLKRTPATDKQLGYVMMLAEKTGRHYRENCQLTKYDASIMIDELNRYLQLKEKIREAQEKLEKADTDKEAYAKKRLEADGQVHLKMSEYEDNKKKKKAIKKKSRKESEVKEPSEDGENINTLFNKYSRVKIEKVQNGPSEDGELIVRHTFKQYNPWTKPSEKQLQFFMSLAENNSSYCIQHPSDIQSKVLARAAVESFNSGQIARMIDILLAIKSTFRLSEKRPHIDMKDIYEQVSQAFPKSGTIEVFRIPCLFD